MPVYAFSDRNRVVRTTAYTCSEDDHLVYGSKNATGTHLRYSNRVRSAAADWSFYPVGTVFRIKGLPYLYVVDDYGSALTGTGTVDIYKPSNGAPSPAARKSSPNAPDSHTAAKCTPTSSASARTSPKSPNANPSLPTPSPKSRSPERLFCAPKLQEWPESPSNRVIHSSK
jgi:3D (Asp-Asp-Asp) domain-containing protein